MALFGLLAVFAGGKKVLVIPNKSPDNGVALSWDFALTVAALLRFGPAAAVLMACIGGLASCLYPRRQPLYQIVFNLALAAAEAWLAGLMFLWINGEHLALRPVETIPAMIVFCFVSYVINSVGVAGIVALCTGQKATALWREAFLWAFPSNLAGASASTLALWLFHADFGLALLLIAPVIFLIYQWYAVYTARMQEKQSYLEEKQEHIEQLQLSQASLADLYLATIKSLALAIDAKDQYTHQHILRVQRYAVATAKHMGLTGDALEGLNTGALLHDIGKLGVPEYVLLKPGRLTEEEFAKVKRHPEIGAAILDPVEFPWPVLPVVKSHHEKWDGSGYPEGLSGEGIPLTARILAVGDVYDALTSSRSYRSAWTHERAIDVIIQDSGTHFDPQVVYAFLQVIDGVVAEMAGEKQQGLDTASDTGVGVTSQSSMAAQAIHRASSELWALYEVAQTLSSSLGLQETLEILSRKLEGILPGTACLFLLRDDGGPEGAGASLLVRTAVGVNREFFQGARTLGPGSKSLAVTADRETYEGVYDADDLMPNSSATVQWEPLQSALIVPIVHQGEVLGTINLYHPQADAFGPHDRQLLETIAERSAMALYNGLLYDRTRSHAMTDPLTGLYNVRYLTAYVEEQCQREDGEPFSLLCLDLDSFKPINDNFGHQKGDQVLRDLSRLFLSVVGPRDVVARYGGDEFLIVLHGAEFEQADAMAQRLQAAVVDYDPGLYHFKLGNLRLGVSIGFGCFPGDGQDCNALLAAADTLMYHNKMERKLGSLASRELPLEIGLPFSPDSQDEGAAPPLRRAA